MIEDGKLDENLIDNMNRELYNLEDQYKLFMSICESIEKEAYEVQDFIVTEKLHQKYL